MDVTLKKVTSWGAAGMLFLAVAGASGTGVLGAWDWKQGSDGSHVVTAKNETAIERIVDVLEGMRDERCIDLMRRCMEKAQGEGTDPLPCLEIECAKSGPGPQ